MNMDLTPEQVAFFQENGYLILPRLFSEEELEALRRRAEWIASGEAPHVPEAFRQVEPQVAQQEQAADSYVLSLRKLSHLAWYDEVIADIERRAGAGDLPDEVPLVMQAGQCSLHHGHLLHSSFPNRSDHRRRGYATHYVSARCRYTGPEPKPEFPLVRGEQVPGCL